MMALGDLAALAVKVKGFVRPLKYCDECDDPMDFPGKVRDEYGQTRTCGWCDGTGTLHDDSPAALAMAVQQHVTKYALCSELDDERVVVHAHGRTGTCDLSDASAESVARALLAAFVQAHGVDVADEGTVG
jgi:hypothetical protein